MNIEFEVIKEVDEKKLAKARKFNKKHNEVKLDKMRNRLEKMNKVEDAMPVVGLILLFIGIIIFFTRDIQEDSVAFIIFTCIALVCWLFNISLEDRKAHYTWVIREIIRNNKLLDRVEYYKNIEVLKLKINPDGCIVKYKKPDGVVEKEHLGWDIEEASMCANIDKAQIYFKYDIDFEYIDRVLIPCKEIRFMGKDEFPMFSPFPEELTNMNNK